MGKFTLRDRISFARAMLEGERQFINEIRDNRAAGNDDNHETHETVSDNIGSHKPDSPSNEKDKKSEQQEKAEAQAPEEEPGAEKIKGSNTAKPVEEAAKSGSFRVDDNGDPSVMKFDDFGITIDLSGDDNNTPPNPFNRVVTNPSPNPVGYAGVPYQVPNFSFSGFDGMNSYMNHLSRTGNGLHKVDQPKTPKVERPKAEPDKVNLDIPNLEDGMEVSPYTPPKEPEIITGKIEKPESVNADPIVPMFNNEIMFNKYNFLKDIERIALENNMQIRIMERPNTKIVDVYIHMPNGAPVINKGFAIDIGNIIDHRKKVFPGIQLFYEGCQAYPLFIPSGDNKGGKKGPNVLNESLIKGLIVGGNDYPDVKTGLYTPEFREISKYVALITIPTKDMNPANRKAIQNRLVELYKRGVFTAVTARDPGSRFIISSYDKDTGNFTLSNKGVPKNYGGPIVSKEVITIDVTQKKATANYTGKSQ